MNKIDRTSNIIISPIGSTSELTRNTPVEVVKVPSIPSSDDISIQMGEREIISISEDNLPDNDNDLCWGIILITAMTGTAFFLLKYATTYSMSQRRETDFHMLDIDGL